MILGIVFGLLVLLILVAGAFLFNEREACSYWQDKYQMAIEYIEWIEAGKPKERYQKKVSLPPSDPRNLSREV